MGMIMLSVFGLAALIAIIFFSLKLFAITAFNIPGSGYVFAFFMVTIPYFILFGAYYLVHKKISSSKTNTASVAARLILTVGSLICIAQLTIALLSFFKVYFDWMGMYESYNKAWFALHLILILISAGVLATGDPKEKNWMERKQ